MSVQSQEGSSLLRRALMGNALFSTISGLIILFARGWVSRILGLRDHIGLAILGIGLLIFAATLVTNVRRQQVDPSDAWIAVSMEVVWVLLSCVLIFVVPFSTAGKWVVLSVAELVLLFAVLQFVGIRRIQKSEHFG
jgi:hypothetical protein